MWKLIQAEFSYNKYLFIFPLGLILVAMIANIVQGWVQVEEDLLGVRSIITSMVAFIYFFRYMKNIKEKRDQQHVLLPLSLLQVAIARLLFVIIIWSSLLLLYWIATCSVRPYLTDIIIWETLSVTGLILIANAFPFIHVDLTRVFNEKYQRAILSMFYVVIVILGVIIFMLFNVNDYSWVIFKPLLILKNNFIKITKPPVFALFCLLSGMVITILNLIIFKNRKTYIQ